MDLGHGAGKGVLAGCLMHPFEKCIGIEILENLYWTSENLKERYDEIMQEMQRFLNNINCVYKDP